MTLTQKCDRCTDIAVARIPLPNGARKEDIHLCDRHAKQARARLYYVVDKGENEGGPGVAEYLRMVDEKHLRLRGSLDLRYAAVSD